jgi:hypothetical protein
MSIIKAPYIKGKNFCPNPVVKYGIPKYADSSLNKKLIGTPDFEKYWSEQLYYIHNGYQTGGIFLPGRFYYYMNFNTMSTVNGLITPDMVDLHLELSYLIEYAKANHKNIIIGKARRKGISEFTHKAVVDYGWRFKNGGYNAGVAAGLKDYAVDFLTKWNNSSSLMPLELTTGTLISNDDEVTAGYEIQNENKQWVEKGTKNKINVRTMFSNPNLFKGLALNDVVAEECGEFPNLIEFYNATEDCLMDGDVQIGTMFFYGTGGNINKGSKDFKYIWEHPDEFNMIKFLVPATRFYKPNYGGATRNGQVVEEIPALLQSHKKFELIGVEDEIAARKSIEKKSEQLRKSGNNKKYLEYKQNNPLEEKDIFRKTTTNNFDSEKLNDQEYKIATTNKKYSKWKLEWVRDENGLIKHPLAVVAMPMKKEDLSKECFLILDGEHPRKGTQNLYVAGADSYDQDIARTTKSLGAMCVLIRANSIQGAMQKAPVAVVCTRPARKEIFYDMCLRLAVYYNIRNNVLVDVAKPQIIKYFEDRSALDFLARRPKKFESERSEQQHMFGVSLNGYSRPMMTALMESAIYYNVDQIWFNHTEELTDGTKIQCDLINQLGNFDEVEIGSDNDLADAYGISLMQDVSCEYQPTNEGDVDVSKLFDLYEGSFDKFGNAIPEPKDVELKSDEQDTDIFGLR